SYVNLKIATCLVRYADDRLIDQRFLKGRQAFVNLLSALYEKPDFHYLNVVPKLNPFAKVKVLYVRAKPISRYFEIFSEVAGISFLYLMKSPCVMPPIVERFPQAGAAPRI
ncbi:hypothetical protein, partial [Burkholderia multivorans]|uniref:hypothetical protein n=1 Tax=Burkholderia multivorans TaxID=87883 RepID=UPI00286FBBB1